MRNRGSRRHQRAVSRVKTSNASAGSVATIVETRTRGCGSATAPPCSWLAPVRTGPLRVRLEGVQLAGPEPFDFRQPAVQLGERLGAEAEDAQPCVLLDRHGLDEPG